MIGNSKQKVTRGTSGILSEADAGTAFSSVIDTVLGKIWQVIENEEYVEVVTDADGTFLRGIKRDGSVEWAKGVPAPIREICPSERIDNPEWLFLWCVEDSEGGQYPLMGIKKDYTFWCAKNSTEFDPTELEKKLYDLSLALSSTKEELTAALKSRICCVNKKIEETAGGQTALNERVSTLENKKMQESDCSEELMQKIESSGGGTIVNAADGQDITSVDNKLQLASRPFGQNNYGYVRLRKNAIEESSFDEELLVMFRGEKEGEEEEGNAKSLEESHKICTASAMSATHTIYEVVHKHDLGGRVVRIPDDCVLWFNGGTFTNGTILSNKTKVINLPSATSKVEKYAKTFVNTPAEIDIVGKIYNIYGQEITVRGDVINRHTPLCYNYEIRMSDYKYDGNGINNSMRLARNLGVTDCIITMYIRNNHSTDSTNEVMSDEETDTDAIFNGAYYVSGYWSSPQYRNKPFDLAKEIYLNGLSVKAIKFHAGGEWPEENGTGGGGMSKYKEFIYEYTKRLSERLAELGLPDFQDVYIVNERGDFTDIDPNGTSCVSLIKELAQDVNGEGKTARCSFAGEYQMANADPSLYDHLKPAFNVYPALSFKDGKITPADDLVSLMAERFMSIGTFWQGRYNMNNIALSEIGTRPAIKALRAPEAYGDEVVGEYYGDAMILFWKTFAEVARKMNFEYVCVWYWDYICDWYVTAQGTSEAGNTEEKFISNRGSEIEDDMYRIFLKM